MSLIQIIISRVFETFITSWSFFYLFLFQPQLERTIDFPWSPGNRPASKTQTNNNELFQVQSTRLLKGEDLRSRGKKNKTKKNTADFLTCPAIIHKSHARPQEGLAFLYRAIYFVFIHLCCGGYIGFINICICCTRVSV